MNPTTTAVLLADASAALDRADWSEAVALLTRADGIEPLSVAGLEMLARACYAAGEMEATVTAWERVHDAHLDAGDRQSAAISALMVGMFLMMDSGMMSPVRAWLRRADRLLEGGHDTPAHAWVGMLRACEALMSGDVDAMDHWSAVAVELGERHDVMPAVAIGRTEQARSQIFRGRVAEGLAMLDEVAELLLTGEVDPLTTGMVWCELVCAAQGLAQYDRAQEWTEAMERWRHGTAFGGINGRCRVHQAEILRLRGPYDAAEEEALRACESLRPWMRREFGWPLTELGTIRLRRGDLAGAEEAFLAAHERAWDPEPGLALLRLAQGDADAAMTLITRALDHPLDVPSKERPPGGGLRRAPLLEAKTRIAVAAGQPEVAAAAAEELAEIAEVFGSRALRAAACVARARVALATDDVDGAVARATDAVTGWSAVGAPWECADARTVLADAHERSGDLAAAALERRIAADTFDRLGVTGRDDAPRPPGTTAVGVTGVFTAEGDLRRMTWNGQTILVKDLKGLRYLARLLAEPGREMHALDLVAVDRGDLPRGTRGPDGPMGGGGDAGPLLDAQAKAAYRRRLAEIDAEIEEADEMHDLERAARARADREYLIAELSRAVGLGGRDRRAGDPAERARTSVTRSLRYALARIAEHHATLAEHLDRTVRTGTYCAYEPDPAMAVSWDVG